MKFEENERYFEKIKGILREGSFFLLLLRLPYMVISFIQQLHKLEKIEEILSYLKKNIFCVQNLTEDKLKKKKTKLTV